MCVCVQFFAKKKWQNIDKHSVVQKSTSPSVVDGSLLPTILLKGPGEKTELGLHTQAVKKVDGSSRKAGKKTVVGSTERSGGVDPLSN